LFEALHGHFFAADPGAWHWRSWPAAFRDRASPQIAAFAREHAGEIDFHAWLQFRADSGLATAQAACRGAGMGIGLISDLAVGTDSGGSQCWSRQQETLLGLSVGAPPDLLQRQGQNWGLTAFSPPGMVAAGFSTYRDMLHTALAHAGGMRIDHAMGLNRLWVIPDGASGAEGAYLSFPERDLLRLIALESQRHRAIVLAEDLGTVPDGFQDRLREAGLCGMRVLWFERDLQGDFIPPAHWTHRAAAMTSTHDLPTVAGWWAGRDIDWNLRLGNVADEHAARAERAGERTRIWAALCRSGAADGPPPAPGEGARAADAACAHVGGSACELVVLPIEDALALVEQPNLPGTLHEHPNWQRRLPETLFDGHATRRLALLDQARKTTT
jgi:4-alpha-glucanotransferase